MIVSAEDGVLANDTDPDGGQLFAVYVSGPTHGELELDSDGSFVYTPDANFVGQDVFMYQASDGALLSNVATVTIDVTPIDDAPVAVDDLYFIEDNGILVVSVDDGVLANDFDVEGDPLSAQLVEGPSHGTLEFNDDGSFTYEPDTDFVGRDSYTYQAIAGERESNIATVRIDVGDLRPSRMQGFVYVDTDNDGRMDDGEHRIGGVRIRLTGTDLLGNSIDLSTRTDGDGSYQFSDLLRGQYRLTEFQPTYMIDGYDTHQGALSLRNDRFEVDLAANTVAGNFNFGERGLEPQFILNPWFFASRDPDYLLTMMNGAGQTMWYVLDAGWGGFHSVDVKLAGNRSTAELTVTDQGGNDQTEVVRVLGNPSVVLGGELPRGYLLKMSGGPEDYGFSDPDLAEGEPLSAAAIDAAFASDDA